MDVNAAHALIRFGLGRRGSDPLPADPLAWLAGQVTMPDPQNFAPNLPATADGLAVLREQRRLKQQLVPPVLQMDVHAQVDALISTDAPYRERLVWFWANHFTVSLHQPECAAVVGPYVREAIRPHVNGRFFDMLLAVMRHPAMLLYLDNVGSVGPASVVGKHDHRGLNENLARECLELHTVSPAGGYTQADVTEFAKVLTGWTFDMRITEPGFVFRPEWHEPGSKTVMGQVAPEGDAGGVVILHYLAHHPATYRHLATKLVRHFVADNPPPEAVAQIAATLHDTNGDLGAAALALIRLPQAWTPQTKFRTPWDYAVACMRALDMPTDTQTHLPAAMERLAQPVWNAPLPNGWADTAAPWVAPEALVRRIDWSYDLSANLGARDPAAMAETVLGPLLKPATLAAMHGAGSRREALTLLLTSPEFFRR